VKGQLASRRRPELRAWMTAHATCDLADLVITWAARERLPATQTRLAMGVAAASTAIAVTVVARLRIVGDQPAVVG
jgi:hypothetical protein